MKVEAWIDIRQWTGTQRVEELFRLAQDREAYAVVVADVKLHKK